MAKQYIKMTFRGRGPKNIKVAQTTIRTKNAKRKA